MACINQVWWHGGAGGSEVQGQSWLCGKSEASQAWGWAHALITTPRRQRQKDLHEFKAILVYRVRPYIYLKEENQTSGFMLIIVLLVEKLLELLVDVYVGWPLGIWFKVVCFEWEAFVGC